MPLSVFLSITDRGFEILLLKITSKLNIAFVRTVHNKFSGMQDLSLFRGDYRDLKTSVRSGNFNYQLEQGFRVSMGLGCEIGKGNRAGYVISILT